MSFFDKVKDAVKKVAETDTIWSGTEKEEAPTTTKRTTTKSKTAAKTRAKASARTYTVQSGDTLSGIAQAMYGNAALWHDLYEANQDEIGGNPNLIRIGQTLVIPDLD